jgi:response regulator RpfG family c-di-GMP phosphodiesterase
MSEKILFVDDEPNVLAGVERQLRKRYEIETAPGGTEGLAALDTRGPFAVVVSDMRMPVMDGAQFLARVYERHPNTVRLLLTGYSDVRSAIDAVNQGHVFRFLTKPCPPDALTGALDAALAQYRLQTAERELLDRTLRGSVQVLGEVLAIVNPTAFGQVARVQKLVRELAGAVEGAGAWEVEVAVVLSRLGCVAIPEAVLTAAGRGAQLGPDEQRQINALPAITRELLRPIPRLERVSEIIDHLDRPFGIPSPSRSERTGKALPLGSRLLKLAFDYDTLVARGLPAQQAVAHLRSRGEWYDPDLLAALESSLRRQPEPQAREVWAGELACGMVLAEDVYNEAGSLLLRRGNPITEPLKHRLEVLATTQRTPKQFRVLVPPTAARSMCPRDSDLV